MGEAFPSVHGAHYLEDFPLWDLTRRVDGRTVVGCFNNSQQLLGGAGARIVEMQVPGRAARMRGAVIGAVATAQNARKQGVATRCLEHLLQWCDSSGAEFVALWGSDHTFYRKFGFELLGQQARAPVVQCSKPPAPADKIQHGWNAEISRALCASRTKSGLHLNDSDHDWIAAHAHVQWWSLWRENQLVAYAGVGKGMDLHHFVHEWGATGAGDQHALETLLGAIGASDAEAQILAHPRDLPNALIREGLALLRLRTDSARALVDQFWFWGLDSA